MSGGEARRVAIVAIGRNEGARLRRCLDSVLGLGAPVVYVDSGSSDGSAELARSRGAVVVELDRTRPFTAGRARNEGLERSLALAPSTEFVQFVDGDCELAPGWLSQGAAALAAEPGLAAVCGRVRERERERSIYHRLCDLEWDVPAGEAESCGGNAMVRVRAFQEVGGFSPELIAGEEPELCLRLRRRGWRLRRLAADMVRHDAEMTRFGQWWRRALRAGWGYTEGAVPRSARERLWVHEAASIAFWGALVPVGTLSLAWVTRGGSLLLLGGYPVLAARIYRRARASGTPRRDASLVTAFTVLAKFPQAVGQAQYLAMRALGRRRRVVDWREAA